MLIIFILQYLVNGNWGVWSSITACSQTCGSGVQTKSRLCNNPAPLKGGEYCAGLPDEDQDCNTHKCPSMFQLFHIYNYNYNYNYYYNYNYNFNFSIFTITITIATQLNWDHFGIETK
jgi:hypothetical protein